MKKILVLAFALMIFASAGAENRTVTFTVNPPLVCNNCETKVKDNIRFEKGVKAVKPSFKKGIVEVTYDDSKTNVPALVEGFKKIGYDATICEPVPCEPTVCPESGAPCCNQSPQAPCCNETPVAPCCNEAPVAPCNEAPCAPVQ